MDIQSRPELEDLVRHEIECGPYRSVEHAVSLLHAQESWVAQHRAEVNAKSADAFAGEVSETD
jgi:hypothetical protein